MIFTHTSAFTRNFSLAVRQQIIHLTISFALVFGTGIDFNGRFLSAPRVAAALQKTADCQNDVLTRIPYRGWIWACTSILSVRSRLAQSIPYYG